MTDGTGSPSEVVQVLAVLLGDHVRDIPRLQSLTTRAAALRWGDFSFLALNWAALDRPGVMMQEQSEPDVFDVVYVPIIQGVDDAFTFPPDGLVPVIGVFTLAYSTTRGRWLVHDFTEHSRRPDPDLVPRD